MLVINKNDRTFQILPVTKSHYKIAPSDLLRPRVTNRHRTLSFDDWFIKYHHYITSIVFTVLEKLASINIDGYDISVKKTAIITFLTLYLYETSENKNKNYYFLK